MSGRKRCAVYTRKSSEDGLEQDFNSLDAQREACAAYIKSQSGEGWRAISQTYDDGGISGGTMERPALKRLLNDIEGGQVDIVVVYKIDRLTRSLADFARMVEVFDRKGVSFVSVTQAFNTTSSMGRLTLNVLLSFAQFEREVTGERIRDKIAASKAKGMWMGGNVPLGYDLPANGNRALIVNQVEADTVRLIFKRYLALGSVHVLQQALDADGVRSKRRTTQRGKIIGGQPFSRGALFHLLRNRTYLGMITHKDKTHAGLHQAIVEPSLFEAVQEKLDANARRRASNDRVANAPLLGRIYDADGQPMSPTFSYGKQGKLYRYYVSAPLQQGHRPNSDGAAIRRISAPSFEAMLERVLRRLNPAEDTQPLRCIERVEVHADAVHLLAPVRLLPVMRGRAEDGERVDHDPVDPKRLRLILPVRVVSRSGRATIIPATGDLGPRPDKALIRALRAAHALVEWNAAGMPTLTIAPTSSHKRSLVRLAFLAPDLQRAILQGRQPPGLTVKRLMQGPLPPHWDDQILLFGAPKTPQT